MVASCNSMVERLMARIAVGDRWLKDFGSGTTDDIDKAHQYTDDEAWALVTLYEYDTDYFTTATLAEPAILIRKPTIPAGPDMVWVQYKDIWLAAERQALFIGTRKALHAEREREVAAKFKSIEEDMA